MRDIHTTVHNARDCNHATRMSSGKFRQCRTRLVWAQYYYRYCSSLWFAEKLQGAVITSAESYTEDEGIEERLDWEVEAEEEVTEGALLDNKVVEDVKSVRVSAVDGVDTEFVGDGAAVLMNEMITWWW